MSQAVVCNLEMARLYLQQARWARTNGRAGFWSYFNSAQWWRRRGRTVPDQGDLFGRHT